MILGLYMRYSHREKRFCLYFYYEIMLFLNNQNIYLLVMLCLYLSVYSFVYVFICWWILDIILKLISWVRYKVK